jgi:hypothetical protein
MNRLLPLLAALALATPAAAQSSNDALEPLLTRWGVPPAALSVFLGTEENARRALGDPSGERTFPNEIYGGPGYRVLEYRLPGGRRMTLGLCTAHERTGRGISRPQVFCEMVVYPSASGDRVSDADVDRLRRSAERTFGECDTAYHVFDGVIVSFPARGDDRVIVLEPFPRDGETIPAR